MESSKSLITANLKLLSLAVKAKPTSGRGSKKKVGWYGIEKIRELILDFASKGLLEKGDRDSKFVRLQETAELVMGQAPPGKDCNSNGKGTVFVKTGEFGKLFPEEAAWTTNPLRFAKNGDVLICVVGATIGKLNLGIECAIGRSVAAIRPNTNLDTKYLYYSLMPYTLKLRRESRGSAQGVIGKGELNSIILRLPSLAEQHRIVAKVDELMARCDQLEQEQENNLETHENLVGTLLNALTSAAADASQFAEAWQRIQDHFDILFTTESSIEQLKQTILQLAVMGKIVKQDVEKEQVLDLVVNKIRAPSPETTTPFELPPSWLWSHLNQLAVINGGFAFKSGNYNNNGTRVVRISDFDEYGFKSGKIVRHEFSAEHEKFRLVEGDILMAMTGGTVGKSFHVKSLDEPMIVNQRVATIRASKAIASHFLHIVIQSKGVQEEINKAKNSTNDNISMKQINSFLVPLPPLAEQHRIVNKVDKLMELCDQLKASLDSAQETQLNLADSIMEQAIHSPA